ncbi:hypothetical protein HHX47_DHR1000478 [Lentinula edodes]|nr:hypothetical protein HHX47_DHR1000478 [Lentinula edodes]
MPQSPEVQHQTRLSSYFTPSPSPKKAKRRASAIVDLTIDSSDEERPFKRQRGSSTSLDISPGPSKSSSASASYNRAEQWSFDSSHSTSTEKDRTHISNSELGSNKLSKREALKKKLLLERESSFFLQSRSSTEKGSSSRIQSGAIDENRDTDSEPEFWATSNASTSNISKGKQKVMPRAKRPEELGPSGEPWTPLEKQVLKLKGDNPGTLLMIEVGYKYKFFDEDAKIAASVLGMVAFRDRNFTVASIPVERRDIHLKNLLSHGHRVGIVNQVETAALKKVGENRNTPFERKLVRLYTATTYVDAMDSVDMTATHSPPHFLCIVEDRKAGKENDVSIALISVCPSIGDVVYDEFEDTLMRLELEVPTVSSSFPELLLTCKPTGKLLASITSFSPGLVIGLAHMVKHLSTYNVADVLLETKFFTKFSEKSHMVLAANTLRNLEIFENETDHTVHGSLLWVLDQTKTKFGARLMKNWVGHPLTNRVVLQERVDAVEEIITSSSDKLVTLRQILKKLPDLARGLCRIQYGQCTPQELAILLPAFKKIAFAFEPMRDSDSSQAGFNSPLLNDMIHAFPALRSSITELIGSICIKRAAEGRKDQLWLDKEKYPRIEETRMGLHAVEIELREMLKTVRKILKRPSLEYETVAGEEIEANHAYSLFLDEISENHYATMRNAPSSSYTRPEFVDIDQLEIVEGRHPMIELLRSDPFIPNTIRMGSQREPRSKIVTGPNMGGKSSSVRMVALIAIMAQIGCYVPAESVKMGMLDGVYTRMGAWDDIARGRSTFMVEMSETREILHSATNKSLVILDELGRGTSTFDGMSIAHAVLHHLLTATRCKTLFITHYPLVAAEIQRQCPGDVENLHMGYTTEERIDRTRDVVFMYRVGKGIAQDSFGVECGRMAGLPEDLLRAASERSAMMRQVVKGRVERNRIGGREVVVDIDTGSSDLWIIVDNSSGFRSTTYPISLLYGDSRTGTHASGVIGIDSVAIASLNLKSQIFAAINDTNTSVLETGCVGILGLGFPVNSALFLEMFEKEIYDHSNYNDNTKAETDYNANSNSKHFARRGPTFPNQRSFNRRTFPDLSKYGGTGEDQQGQDANNQDNQDNIRPKKNNRRHSSTGPSPWTPRLLAAFNVSGPPIWRIVTGAQDQQQNQSQDIINMRPMFGVSLQRVTNTGDSYGDGDIFHPGHGYGYGYGYGVDLELGGEAAAPCEHPRASIISQNHISGLLTIGGLPPNLTDADLTWALVRRYTVPQGGLKGGVGAEDEVYPITWEIPIDGVYLDGNRIPDPAELESGDIGVTALIDTGNSLIRGPPDVVQYIVDIIGREDASSSSHPSTDTSTSCTTPHTLAFQIGGRMFPVEWRDLVWVEEEDEDRDSQQGDSEYENDEDNGEAEEEKGNGSRKRQCYLNLAPTDVPTTTTTTTKGEGGGAGYMYSWSLGDPFLKNVIAAFYYGDTVHPSWDPPRIGLISTVIHGVDLGVDVEGGEDVGAEESESDVRSTVAFEGGVEKDIGSEGVSLN